MALSKTASPDDRTRFFRLGLVIIEELTPVLQDVLTNEISPSQIFNTVKQNKKLFQKLRPDQIDKIMNAQAQGYNDFDITLLYTILRNLCPNIQEPTKGWGISEMPDQGETTLGDDIERIRLIRNNIYGHISVLSVSETKFKGYWSTIFDICNRTQALLGKNYVQSLHTAERCTIDSARENMYMNKMKDLIEADKSTRELLQRVIKEKDLSSKETVRIETKNPKKKKFADTLREKSIYILNVMVESIHEKTSESEIEQLYEAIEDFIREENEENSRLASDPFFTELTQKITTYANLQKKNKMRILARFLRFNLRIKRQYTGYLVSSEGSLLLKMTFASKRGYDLYRQDLERGEIGKQILEVLLYPPYLASFDLRAEDLVVYLNDHILTKENEPKLLVMDSHMQELKQCDLCKTALVQVHCITCDVKMCNACIGEHTSSEETKKKHEIVKSNLPLCTSHDKEECKMFCNQCDIPLCFICVASEQHADHEISQILQVMNEKKEKIIKEQNELNETILPTYQNIASDVENMIKQLEEECGNISTAITKQGEERHREIDQVVKKLQTEVEEVKTTQLQTLRKHLDEIKKKISEIRDKINSTDVAIDSHDISELFNITLNVDNYRKLPPKIVPSLPKFTPTTVKGEELCSLIGTISSGKLFSEDDYSLKKTQNSSEDGFSLQVKQLLEKPEIITIMKIEKTLLINVACLNDDGIWTSGPESIMKLYSISQGSLLKSIKTKSGFTPGDITVTNHGHLVYTDPKDRTVNIVKNEEIETVIRLHYWKPLNVCRTSTGDLLVVMNSDDNKQSKVVHYSGSTEKQTIRFDDDSKPLYSPGVFKHISENRNLDICVADCAAKAVVVVNQAGKLRFRYTGHTSAPQNKSFFPRGITTDSQSHILTADFFNDCVHIIDQDGQFLTFIDCGLRACGGLCMDTNDNLFVAQWGTRQVMKIKYLQ